MPPLENITEFLDSQAGQSYFARLYGSSSAVQVEQRERYKALLHKFRSAFPEQGQAQVFSAPGRTEVGGNHTDHNAGCVLAAAVDLDAVAVAGINREGLVRVRSQGYPTILLRVDELAPVEAEKNTSAALIRGVLARFQQLGFSTGGFDAAVESRVPKGSGLSSSACYEILMGTILNHLYNAGRVDPVLLAQIGQYAENRYFGKPSGLMDQTASAVGGFVTIDFKDASSPLVKKVDFDFSASGCSLVIVDTKGDHAGLTDEYAAVQQEMRAVAHALGGEVLREFSEADVVENVARLRQQTGDRAVLRALHYYRDNRRVGQMVEALEGNDFGRFLRLVNESGRSSWMLLQNNYTTQAVHQQGIPIALAVSEAILGERGAWRVHGGGFAGTIQAFVPVDLLPVYIRRMEAVMGPGSCYPILVRPVGAVRLPFGG
jgi:galactokinase